MDITKKDLITSLQGKTCPACAQAKRRGETFCGRCYRTLPAPRRNALYQRIGEGYEEAISAALRHLNALKFHMPPAPPTPTKQPGLFGDTTTQGMGR